MQNGLSVVVSKSAIEQEVNRLAMDVVTAEVATGDKYFRLCSYIREKKVLEVTVRREMEECGFRGSRISEVLKVCSAPKDVWEGYLGKLFSFKKALLLVRTGFTGERVVTPVGQLALGDSNGHISIERAEDAVLDVEGTPKITGKPASKTQKCQRAADAIFKMCDKPRQWKSGDGWVLMLCRDKKFAKAKKPSSGSLTPTNS